MAKSGRSRSGFSTITLLLVSLAIVLSLPSALSAQRTFITEADQVTISANDLVLYWGIDDGTNYVYLVSTSGDGGKTWGAATTLAAFPKFLPIFSIDLDSMVVTKSGALVATFAIASNGGLGIPKGSYFLSARNTNKGRGAWTLTAALVVFNSTIIGEPELSTIHVPGSDTIALVTTIYETTSKSSFVYYARSTDGGLSWSSVRIRT